MPVRLGILRWGEGAPQTTLTLAWLEDGVCHLAIVGDGGAAIEARQSAQDEQIVLATPNAETNRVHAIGPGNRHVVDLDTWKQVVATDASLLAIYTDGVGHGIGADASLLFEQLQGYPDVSQTDNVVEQLVQKWIRERPGDFDDNLSLAIVSWD